MLLKSRASFGPQFQRWHMHVLGPSLALTTLSRYEQELRLRLYRSPLMDMCLSKIKCSHIQEMYCEWMEQGASANSIRIINSNLSNFFRYCLKTDMLIKDPMIAVCLPKDRQVRQVFKKTLYKEEVGEIVRYAKRYPGAFVFVFAIFTGLRQGEILALTHRDVRNNMIHVSKTLHYIKAEGKYSLVISPAKTRQSNRVIPLCESLIPMLDAHIELEKGKHLKHGKLFTADAPLFSTAGCDYNSGRNLRGKLRRMYKILGIEPTNFHGLRHTFCSALARNGVNIKTASELMGHASTETTLGIYTHVFEDEKVRGVASLANEFPE